MEVESADARIVGIVNNKGAQIIYVSLNRELNASCSFVLLFICTCFVYIPD